MSRYINEAEICKWLQDKELFYIGYGDENKEKMYHNLRKAIKDMPTADVAPVVHGRWKWLGPNALSNGAYYGTCSVCGLRQSFTSTRFCGNCGAKMDLEDKP